MSLAVIISEKAELDLTLQYRWYLQHADAAVAERYLAAFDGSIQALTSNPGMGRSRHFQNEELSGIRSCQVGGAFFRHLIFYRNADSLSIERVMHGARDLPRRLLEEPGSE